MNVNEHFKLPVIIGLWIHREKCVGPRCNNPHLAELLRRVIRIDLEKAGMNPPPSDIGRTEIWNGFDGNIIAMLEVREVAALKTIEDTLRHLELLPHAQLWEFDFRENIFRPAYLERSWLKFEEATKAMDSDIAEEQAIIDGRGLIVTYAQEMVRREMEKLHSTKPESSHTAKG